MKKKSQNKFFEALVSTEQSALCSSMSRTVENSAEQSARGVHFEMLHILVLSKETEQHPYYYRQHSALECLKCYPILLGKKKKKAKMIPFQAFTILSLHLSRGFGVSS